MPKRNNNKKQSRKQKGRKRQSAPMKRSPGGDLRLTECAARYAISIVSPWDPKAIGACVPNTSRPTYKVTSFARGKFTVGTHCGFIGYTPCLANNSKSIFYSTSGYTSQKFEPTHTGTGITSVDMTNLPFTSAQLLDNNAAGNVPEMRGRIVSCSISVRYIGTELNRGGQIVCFSDPAHNNCHGLFLSELMSRRETVIETPSAGRVKCWVNTYGIDESEREFAEATPGINVDFEHIQRLYPYSMNTQLSANALDVRIGACPMGVMVTGTTGNEFEFEIVQHSEFIGTKADPFLSPNVADPAGTNLVLAAASRLPMKKQSHPGMKPGALMVQTLREEAALIGVLALQKGASMAISALL